MEISRQEDMDPMEALLSLVRNAMGKATYVESVLAEMMRRHVEEGGDMLDPPASIRPWLKESRQERMLAARTAKAAVDAGVVTALAQRVDLEGALVADAVAAALDVLALDQDERNRAISAAHERLLTAD